MNSNVSFQEMTQTELANLNGGGKVIDFLDKRLSNTLIWKVASITLNNAVISGQFNPGNTSGQA